MSIAIDSGPKISTVEFWYHYFEVCVETVSSVHSRVALQPLVVR